MASKPQLALQRPPTESPITNEVLWRQGLNATAFTGADNPSSLWTQMVRLNSTAYRYFREIPLKDSAVKTGLELRTLLVLARGYSVKAADEDDARARFFADWAQEFLSRLSNFRAALRTLLNSRRFGFQVAEVFWQVEGSEIRVEKIVGRPQELFAFGLWNEPPTGALLYTPVSPSSGEPVHPARFLVASFNEENGDRRGQPLLRDVFWLSWFKRNGLRVDLHFLEKPAGTVVVAYPPGATDTDKAKALEAAEAIFAETAVAVPENFKLLAEALASTRTRQGQDYSSFISYCDAEITRVLLFQTLTTRGAEEGRGARALGEVHLDILTEVIDSDKLDLEDVVNNQLLEWAARFQFGADSDFFDRGFRPRWEINPQPQDRLAYASLLKAAVELGAPTIPERVVHDADGLGLPRAEQGEPTLPPSPNLFAGVRLPESLPEAKEAEEAKEAGEIEEEE